MKALIKRCIKHRIFLISQMIDGVVTEISTFTGDTSRGVSPELYSVIYPQSRSSSASLI